MSISENIKAVEAKVAAAAERSGRKREDILLLAVSKTKPVETIREAVESGLLALGENKVQEIMEKYEPMAAYAPEGERIHWHLIGHLQTNKVKYIIDKVDMIILWTAGSLLMKSKSGRRLPEGSWISWSRSIWRMRKASSA